VRELIRRLTWLDAVLLVVVAAAIAWVGLRIQGTLNYEWRWGIIPNYLLRFDEENGRWVANLLLQGLVTTVRISLYASLLALPLGVAIGVARTVNNLTVRMLARTYVELLRNIPPVVVIFIFFFFLSEQLIVALNIEGWARGIAGGDSAGFWTFLFGDMRLFPSMISGVLVLALFESAFVGEIVRAGIESVGRGQREAASSLGMNRLDELRFIVLPQATRRMLPPLANQFIILVKDSSIISLISVQELTYKTVELVSSTRAIFEAWLTTAALYFGLCFCLSMLFRRLERGGRAEMRT